MQRKNILNYQKDDRKLYSNLLEQKLRKINLSREMCRKIKFHVNILKMMSKLEYPIHISKKDFLSLTK